MFQTEPSFAPPAPAPWHGLPPAPDVPVSVPMSEPMPAAPCEPGPPRWDIRVFGGLRLLHAWGAPAPALPRRQSDFLLLLALAGASDAHPPELLCDALWPDSDGAACKSNLDSAVHRLRRVLGGAQAVHVQGGRVWLDASLCHTDLEELRGISHALAQPAAPAPAALRAMAGTLLAITQAGGLRIDARLGHEAAIALLRVRHAWRDATRELALRLGANAAADTTADTTAEAAAADAALAIRLCERYVAHGALDAGLLALWMELLESTGQHLAARHVADQFAHQAAGLDAGRLFRIG